ncbi:hypothetical protein CDIK_4033 [Cucumispora dikerogammari]|nr:hypothetical protein CDIK_4033 [Cucumispora dikerogammari]
MSLNNRLPVSSCKQDKNPTVSTNKIKSETMDELRNNQKKTENKFKTGDEFININDFLLKFRVEISKNKVKFLDQKKNFKRLVLSCNEKDCSFKVVINKRTETEFFYVKHINTKHSCSEPDNARKYDKTCTIVAINTEICEAKPDKILRRGFINYQTNIQKKYSGFCNQLRKIKGWSCI